MPLKWSDVKAGLKISDFNLKNVPELMIKRKDYFKDVLKSRIEMDNAIEHLNDFY